MAGHSDNRAVDAFKAGADGAQTVVIDTVAKMYETILDELGGPAGRGAHRHRL